MPASSEPRLLADIGSMYARFALELAPGVLAGQHNLRCADYPDFLSTLKAYLQKVADIGGGEVRHGAIAIANPVEGDQVQMTNYHWRFSIEETRVAVGFDTLVVVNDFTALAMGVPYLTRAQVRQVGGGKPRERNVIGLVGAGTGLGVSGLIPVDDGWVSLGSEGGHVAFAPGNPREVFILEYAWRQFPHVSAERLVSASGLELIYRALAERAERTVAPLRSLAITQRGLNGTDPLCAEALEVFCEMLGAIAANVAVTFGAFSGVYIGGGGLPRPGGSLHRSGVFARFAAEGPVSRYVAPPPTHFISAPTADPIRPPARINSQ